MESLLNDFYSSYLPNTGHKASEMKEAVIKGILKNDLDIKNCHGQSYDNVSNMSGIYNGLQQRIKNLNSLAAFMPCSAHSLNLVGSCVLLKVFHMELSFSFFCKDLTHFFLFNWQVGEIKKERF